MALEATREQLKEQAAEMLSKLQESSAFNAARERFESQTPAAQRLISIGGAVLFILVVLYIPYTYIDQSQTNMGFFEENREMIQGLLKASKSAKEPSPLPPAMSPEMFRGRVDTILRDNRLLPDQIGDIQPLPGDRPAEKLAPPIVQQSGLSVAVKRLNVSQLVSLGHALQSMGGGTKMLGMDVTQSAAQTHYYDVVYRLVQFSLPVLSKEEPMAPSGRKGKGPPPRKRPSDDEELGE